MGWVRLVIDNHIDQDVLPTPLSCVHERNVWEYFMNLFVLNVNINGLKQS